MNVYLVGSSLLFTIPMSLAAYLHLWDNWFSLFFLTWTSVMYHSTKNQIFVYVDYTAVNILVVQSLRYGYLVNKLWIPATTIAIDGLLFYGGRMMNTFVYHKNPMIATRYHVLLHILAVVGTTITMIGHPLDCDIVDGRNLTHRLER